MDVTPAVTPTEGVLLPEPKRLGVLSAWPRNR